MSKPTRCLRTLTISLALTLAATAAAAEPLYPSGQVAGYGRDGSRIYPDCAPPTTWSDQDVSWETPLPSWGHGSPIVVGGKVFVLCELTPANDFPLLVCLDAETGKLLWQRQVDHLSATGLPPAQQEEVRKTWHDYIGDFYKRQELHAQYREAEDKEDFKAKLETMGYRYHKRWDRVETITRDKRMKELNKQADYLPVTMDVRVGRLGAPISSGAQAVTEMSSSCPPRGLAPVAIHSLCSPVSCRYWRSPDQYPKFSAGISNVCVLSVPAAN